MKTKETLQETDHHRKNQNLCINALKRELATWIKTLPLHERTRVMRTLRSGQIMPPVKRGWD